MGGKPAHVRQGRQLAEQMLIGAMQRGVVVKRMRDRQTVAAELARIFDHLQRLRPQAVGAAVPEEPVIVGGVQQRRRIAGAGRDRLGQFTPVGEGVCRLMAGGARKFGVGRKTRVEEQELTERGGAFDVGELVGGVGRRRGRRRRVARNRGQFIGRIQMTVVGVGGCRKPCRGKRGCQRQALRFPTGAA